MLLGIHKQHNVGITMKKWLYNEFKHCGLDYSKAGQADVYDEQHQKFRNYENEFKEMMDFLGLHDTRNKTIIDLGCGTGAIAIFATDFFRTVYAVDVSEVMIGKAKKKLNKNVHNLVFVNAGFLTYDHEEKPVDLVVT
jgi:ubiquinone/menaquinone biosynthesis C-methylase UbiE